MKTTFLEVACCSQQSFIKTTSITSPKIGVSYCWHYFVWDTASQSTKWLYVLSQRGEWPHRPLLATPSMNKTSHIFCNCNKQGSHTIFKTKFHYIPWLFPWPLLHFFHACLSDTYTCQVVTVLLKIADVALKGSNSTKLAPCVVAVSHLKTKPTLLSISTTYLHCQI